MNRELIQQVWQRAGARCEYCRMPARYYLAPFQIDHIIARQHAGKTELTNLALSCLHCNARKGPNIAGTDPESVDPLRLYHPRKDSWSDHFVWSGAELIGRTAIGRVTIQVLGINEQDFLDARGELMHEGVFRTD